MDHWSGYKSGQYCVNKSTNNILLSVLTKQNLALFINRDIVGVESAWNRKTLLISNSYRYA